MAHETFRNPYQRGGRRSALKFTEPTRTKQSFKAECDINTIMRNYRDHGLLPTGSQAAAKFGDFSSVGDYLDALTLITEAERQFQQLPSDVRATFRNDPGQFLNFIKPENLDQLHAWGMLNDEAKARHEAKKAAAATNAPKTEEKAK